MKSYPREAPPEGAATTKAPEAAQVYRCCPMCVEPPQRLPRIPLSQTEVPRPLVASVLAPS